MDIWERYKILQTGYYIWMSQNRDHICDNCPDIIKYEKWEIEEEKKKKKKPKE